MVSSILSSDILIVDKIVKLKEVSPNKREKIEALMQKHGMQWGGKMAFQPNDLKSFDEFSEALEGCKVESVPGGSSANTLSTMGKLMGGNATTDFIGVVGNIGNGAMIRKSLEGTHIHIRDDLIDPNIQAGTLKQEATSFVIVNEFGERTIATFPGNARDLLGQHMITEDVVQASDALLVQGSLWAKLGETTERVPNGLAPKQHQGFADALLYERWKEGKELWLAMPTQADFGTKHSTHEEKSKHFKWIIKSANVVLGNGEEISRVYTSDDEHKEINAALKQLGISEGDPRLKDRKAMYKWLKDSYGANETFQKLDAKYDIINNSIHEDEALKRLSAEFSNEILAKETANQSQWAGKNTDQVGFITLGKKGSAVVTKEGVTYVPRSKTNDAEIKNTLGAGDSAFAGILTGYVLKQQHPELQITYEDCARLGAWVAREKLYSDGARIADPFKTIQDRLKAWRSEDATDAKEAAFVEKMKQAFPQKQHLNGAHGSSGNSLVSHVEKIVPKTSAGRGNIPAGYSGWTIP